MISVIEVFWWTLRVNIYYRLIRTAFAFSRALIIYWIAPLVYAPDFDRYLGRWTVITGGTDGIGYAYTIELAKRGLRKFVIVGRNAKKLDDCKAFLETTFAARVQTFLFDFYDGNFTELKEFLDGIDIGFVVNSVGVGRDLMERYGDSPEVDHQILQVNGMGSAQFLAIVLPIMERTGGGQIVVMSSSQAYRPIPYIASYCASKSVLSFISEAIDREWTSVRVQCLTPALVATNMTFYDKTAGSLFVKTPTSFAREAINTVGLVTTTSGCFNHEIQMLLRHLFPWSLLKYILLPIYSYHKWRIAKLNGANGDINAKKIS